jgi:hypothetical protein
MRSFLVSTTVLLCLFLQGACLAQCTKDLDCKGNRICVNGVCTERPAVQKCTKDAECPGDLICNNGICVRPSSNQSSSNVPLKGATLPAASQAGTAPLQSQPVPVTNSPDQVQTQSTSPSAYKGTALAIVCQSSANKYQDQAGMLLRSAKEELGKLNLFSGIKEGTETRTDYALTLTITNSNKITKATRVLIGAAAGPAKIAFIAELKDQANGAVLMRESVEKSSVGFGIAGATTESVIKEASADLAGIIQKHAIASEQSELSKSQKVAPPSEPPSVTNQVSNDAPKMPGPEPVGALTNSTPLSRHGCRGNTFFIDGACVEGHLVTTAGNTGFWFTNIFYTLTTLASPGFSIWGGFADPMEDLYENNTGRRITVLDKDTRDNIRWVGFSVGSSPVIFAALNQFSLAKERRYLNQLGVTEGQGLYRATWIMDLVCVGTTGLMAVSNMTDGTGFSGTMSLIDAAAILTTYGLHIACNLKQRGLLQSYVSNATTQQSEQTAPSVTPYASIGPHGGWRAGLTLLY